VVVLGIKQVKQRVKKKRQKIEGGQEGCERLRAMPEVVFERGALRFEGIVAAIPGQGREGGGKDELRRARWAAEGNCARVHGTGVPATT
jgi:hypothetical protein